MERKTIATHLIAVIVTAIVVGTVVFFLVAPAPPAPVKTIKIGYTGPFTGPGAEYGTNGWMGMQIALEEINEKGIYVDDVRHEIEIIRYDSVCKPAEGVANVKRLITEDKVSAILGDHCSSVCMAIGPVINEGETPTITIECAADAITRQGWEYFFRARPSMPLMTPTAAKILVEKLGVKSASYLVIDDDYGRSFAKSFIDSFAKLGVKVLTEDYFERGTMDFMAYLTRIKEAKPDALIYTGATPEGAMIVKQAHELGLPDVMVIIGGEEFAGKEYVEAVGVEGVEGTYAISLILYPPDPKAPDDLVWFHGEMKKRYGKPIHYAAVYAYDYLWAIAKAIENAQSTDPKDIRDALDVIEFEGLSGTISMPDFNGYTNQGTHPVYVMVWRNGEREFI